MIDLAMNKNKSQSQRIIRKVRSSKMSSTTFFAHSDWVTMSPKDDGTQNKQSWSQTLDTPPKILSIQTRYHIPNKNFLISCLGLIEPWTWFGGGYFQIFYGLTGGPSVIRMVLPTFFYTGYFSSIFMLFSDISALYIWLWVMTLMSNRP